VIRIVWKALAFGVTDISLVGLTPPIRRLAKTSGSLNPARHQWAAGFDGGSMRLCTSVGLRHADQ
jgi:hypothetical protein